MRENVSCFFSITMASVTTFDVDVMNSFSQQKGGFRIVVLLHCEQG